VQVATGCRARPGGLPAAAVRACLAPAAAPELCAPEAIRRYFWVHLRRSTSSIPTSDDSAKDAPTNIDSTEMNSKTVALTCSLLTASALDEPICVTLEQAPIHSHPELPMRTVLRFSARTAMLVRLIVFLSCAACVHEVLLSGLTRWMLLSGDSLGSVMARIVKGSSYREC